MSELDRPHVLVVGGTGMLRAVSLALAKSSQYVSVIARDATRLQTLRRQADQSAGDIYALPVDYRDSDALRHALKTATVRRGKFSRAVVWVHAVAPEAPFIIAQHVGEPNKIGRYIHVLSSASADPSKSDTSRKQHFGKIKTLRYSEVILGFVRTAQGSRWLSHAEISQGVLHAINMNLDHYVVGTVKPWSERP
ncbi:MAG: short-chain dehydrogenase [Chloroflexota bacterium]